MRNTLVKSVASTRSPRRPGTGAPPRGFTDAAKSVDVVHAAIRSAREVAGTPIAGFAEANVRALLRPTVERITHIYAASWPADEVDLSALLDETLATVVEQLCAEEVSAGLVMPKVSSAAFRALQAHRARVFAAGVVPTRPSDAPATQLHRVMESLTREDATVLRMRSEGASWERVAAFLGTTAPVAQRRHHAALDAARSAALAFGYRVS